MGSGMSCKLNHPREFNYPTLYMFVHQNPNPNTCCWRFFCRSSNCIPSRTRVHEQSMPHFFKQNKGKMACKLPNVVHATWNVVALRRKPRRKPSQ